MAEMLTVLSVTFLVLGIGAWVEQITRPLSKQHADDWLQAQLAFLRCLPLLRLRPTEILRGWWGPQQLKLDL